MVLEAIAIHGNYPINQLEWGCIRVGGCKSYFVSLTLTRMEYQHCILQAGRVIPPLYRLCWQLVLIRIQLQLMYVDLYKFLFIYVHCVYSLGVHASSYRYDIA